MAIVAAQYHDTGMALLPNGKAWNKEMNSMLSRLMFATALELERVDDVANQITKEALPAQALYLLKEWEEFTGLPDCTIDTQSTIENRRQALAAKLLVIGSLSKEFYIELAKSRGYEITIDEYYPHHCMRPINYPLYQQSNWWTVFITIIGGDVRRMTALDNVKTRLIEGDMGDLMCLFERYKPAHINFRYLD